MVSRSFWEVGAGAGAATALPFPWNFLPGTCGSGLPPPAPPPAAFSPFSFLFFLPPRAAGGGAGAGARPRLGFPAAARGRAPCRAHRGLRTIWRSLCSKPTRACAQTLPFYPRKIIVSSFKINTRLAISTFFPNIIRRGARGRTGPAPRGPEHSCRGPARPGPGAATRGVCAWGRPPPAEPGVARAAQRLRGQPGWSAARAGERAGQGGRGLRLRTACCLGGGSSPLLQPQRVLSGLSQHAPGTRCRQWPRGRSRRWRAQPRGRKPGAPGSGSSGSLRSRVPPLPPS